jgi:hypothetical protein
MTADMNGLPTKSSFPQKRESVYRNVTLEGASDRSLNNFFRLYRPIADSWLIIDNSQVPPNKTIAWRNLGGPVQIDDLRAWDELRRKYEIGPTG